MRTLSTAKVLRTIEAAHELNIADPHHFIELARKAGLAPMRGRRGSFVWSESDVEVVRVFIAKGIVEMLEGHEQKDRQK